MKQSQTRAQTVSIIIPFFNEEGNIFPIIEKIHGVLDGYNYAWELVLVNDGSIDRTAIELEQVRDQYGNHVRIIELQRNFGQTAAMQAGIDTAKGSILITMDGDMQNDPADIPGMVETYIKDDLDLLVGWRKDRKDKLLLRKIPSLMANRLIGRVTGVYMHDYGCSFKVYRASVIKNIRLYGEMHRFIPAWVAAVVPPHRIAEKVVRHNERTIGQSKYGISRTFRVLIDLLSVWFFMKFKARPGHFFGSIGLGLGGLGVGILSWLGFDKFVLGNDIGTRPLLLVGVVMVIASLQFLTTGVLAELMSRIYFENSNQRAYTIRSSETQAISGWKESDSS